MTRLIAIDTSTSQTLWCGLEDGRPLDPVSVSDKNKHDTVLAEGVKLWVDEHGWRETLSGIAVVVGPGGFTGLRVGVAFATGLAEALQLPVIPVETPRMLAARVENGLVWVITRAGGQKVKGQVVRGGPDYKTIGKIIEFAPSDSVPLPAGDDSILPLGDGYELLREPIDAALGERLRINVPLKPTADALAQAAMQVFQAGGAVSPLDVDVVYGSEFRPTPKPKA
jgi:tRNA threonylcarbamoyladenosine biosynthesis protein TsaB